MAEITYRPIRPTDFDDLHAIVSGWAVTRQLGSWPWPADPAFTRSRCVPYVGDGFVVAVCDADRLIGSLGVTDGRIGYMLSPDYHGQGIMSAAVGYALNRAFGELRLDVVRASTWIDNVASHGLLLRAGFVQYATHYGRSCARKRPALMRNYRLTRTVWHRLRNSAQ